MAERLCLRLCQGKIPERLGGSSQLGKTARAGRDLSTHAHCHSVDDDRIHWLFGLAEIPLTQKPIGSYPITQRYGFGCTVRLPVK